MSTQRSAKLGYDTSDLLNILDRFVALLQKTHIHKPCLPFQETNKACLHNVYHTSEFGCVTGLLRGVIFLVF